VALIFCASTSGKQFDAISPQCPVAPGTGQKANPSRDARGAPRATERQVISAALAVSGSGSAPWQAARWLRNARFSQTRGVVCAPARDRNGDQVAQDMNREGPQVRGVGSETVTSLHTNRLSQPPETAPDLVESAPDGFFRTPRLSPSSPEPSRPRRSAGLPERRRSHLPHRAWRSRQRLLSHGGLSPLLVLSPWPPSPWHLRLFRTSQWTGHLVDVLALWEPASRPPRRSRGSRDTRRSSDWWHLSDRLSPCCRTWITATARPGSSPVSPKEFLLFARKWS